MNTIGKNRLWSYYTAQTCAEEIHTPWRARKAEGHSVQSYLELAKKIAELQYLNPDFVLMFRGQTADHRNTKGLSCLKPSIFRPDSNFPKPPKQSCMQMRYEELKRAEKSLVATYGETDLPGVEKLQRHRILRWAILQHYGICKTPLLDVTHSLRIAASFASMSGDCKGFIFVVGVPNLSGAITASVEGLQIVRLASVCPPSAVRPHIQEGYLLGEYPDMVDYDQKELYHHYEIDFGRRLIAKFRLNPKKFWRDPSFPQIPNEALYPEIENDPLRRVAKSVKTAIAQN